MEWCTFQDDRPCDGNILNKRDAYFPECQRTGRFRRSRGLVVTRRCCEENSRYLIRVNQVLEEIQGMCTLHETQLSTFMGDKRNKSYE